MPSIVCLIAPLVVFALGVVGPADAQDSQPPTPIEAALVARACQAIETPSTDIDAHLQCVSAQLLALRASFGRDLSRLSRSDRTKIDTVCSPLGTGERRDAYLDCVGDQLAAVRSRLTRGKPAASENAVVEPSPLLDPAVGTLSPADQAAPGSSSIVVGGIVGSVLLAAGGVAFLALRSRPAPRRRTCRACGLDSADSDLCPACRHEAAEALRRTALERALTQKAQEQEDERHRAEEAEKQRAREKEEKEEEDAAARLREQELRRQQEEDERRRNQAAAVPIKDLAEEVFDPYVVLGTSHETNQDGIRTAYEQAITKYDPTLVSHLSEEVQAHFRAKAESIERAYQMLSNAHL